jgi:hypothetical protein
MSQGSARIVCNVTLTGLVQTELENVIRANTLAMTEEQLHRHIEEINKELEALVQLLTKSRLYKLPKREQFVKDNEARILV